uniref:Uncharacterized protein n=1 Tax=Spongospora subterranea TaxID=70186 RepID=A0A0H5R3Y7_9EUKA|eukprot:CRZ02734.1 hypothetical protein [Spongospora subterranea]
MKHYNASKNKSRRFRCGARPVYINTKGTVLISVFLTIICLVGIYYARMLLNSPDIDYRFGDVCSYLRQIDHPVPKLHGESKILLAVHITNMEQLGNTIDQTMFLIDRIGDADFFISMSIDQSLSMAGSWVHIFHTLLKSRRIRFAHFFTSQEGRHLLQPMWDRSFPATHVIFIQDSFFCAEDVVRLYGQIGNPANSSGLACGLQFEQSNKRRMHVRLNIHTATALGISSDYLPDYPENPALRRLLTGHTSELSCCWSNAVGIHGILLAQEPSEVGDCLGYDCQHLCSKSKTARLLAAIPVVPDHGTRSLLAVAPLHLLNPIDSQNSDL